MVCFCQLNWELVASPWFPQQQDRWILTPFWFIAEMRPESIVHWRKKENYKSTDSFLSSYRLKGQIAEQQTKGQCSLLSVTSLHFRKLGAFTHTKRGVRCVKTTGGLMRSLASMFNYFSLSFLMLLKENLIQNQHGRSFLSFFFFASQNDIHVCLCFVNSNTSFKILWCRRYRLVPGCYLLFILIIYKVFLLLYGRMGDVL